MEHDYDLLVSILPFEKEWYAERVPRLRVEFVGNPIIDRHPDVGRAAKPLSDRHASSSPTVLLLPGSRVKELKRHLPVFFGALARMRATLPQFQARMVLATDALVTLAKATGLPAHLEVRTGALAQSLAEADVAVASTGTVTLECAYFRVPTVAIYKAAWSDYQIARHIVNVQYLAMPNLLAHEEIFPEFIQQAATPENIARAALELLRDEKRRAEVKTKLAAIVAQLGTPGASRRAARAIARRMEPEAAVVNSQAEAT